MGWLWQYKPTKLKEFLDSRMNHTDADGTVRSRVLRSAFVGFSEYYAAVEFTQRDTGRTFVLACLYMLKFTRDGEFGRKDMDEACGPVISKCPETILNLLTPIEEVTDILGENGTEWATNWRARCRDYHARRRDRTVQDWMKDFDPTVVAAWQANLNVRIGYNAGYIRAVPHIQGFWLVKTPRGRRGWPVSKYSPVTEVKMGKNWFEVKEVNLVHAE